MPINTKVSNEDQFKNSTFYERVDDDFHKVCGIKIEAVPTTFKGYMADAQGIEHQNDLEDYLNGTK